LQYFETRTCARSPGPATPRSMGRLGLLLARSAHSTRKLVSDEPAGSL
jgi:hypothetical protein